MRKYPQQKTKPTIRSCMTFPLLEHEGSHKTLEMMKPIMKRLWRTHPLPLVRSLSRMMRYTWRILEMMMDLLRIRLWDGYGCDGDGDSEGIVADGCDGGDGDVCSHVTL
jgi:hypothetical protein